VPQGQNRPGLVARKDRKILAQSAARTIYVPMSATRTRRSGHACHKAKALTPAAAQE